VKRQNWILGIIISLGISLLASSPRLIRMDKIEIGFVLSSILYNFFFCIFCWFAHNSLLKSERLLYFKYNRFLLGLSSIIIIGLLVFLYDWIFSSFTDVVLQFSEIKGNKRNYILLLRGLLVSGLYYFIAYYLHILSEKQKSSIEIERLKQAQLAANLFSLKEQLSPHFLFNTLNTLSSLTQEKTVKDYVAELANVYRYVLQYKDLDKATLKNELSFIESYLYIIKTRLEDSIEIKIDVDHNLLSTKIPPLTLQLLIENAMKHNVASSSRRLVIQIYNEANEYLVINNNFQPKSSVKNSTGIGLENVLQRYRLLFNKEISIEKSETLFTVKLPII
jgi:two-component system, LytTR family, sensor kinase